TTNIPFHLAVLDEPEFRAGRIDTGYIARVFGDRPAPRPGPDADLAAALAAAAAALEASRDGAPAPAPAGAAGGRPSPWRLALRQARPSA
ncbi:MAG TPA: acetyl-CoA carboxylase biotin carboxylase subunit, partial [Thermodesulfobacteriota bacterium]